MLLFYVLRLFPLFVKDYVTRLDAISILFVWLVSPDGIVAFCKDVHVDHTDVRMLILAW